MKIWLDDLRAPPNATWTWICDAKDAWWQISLAHQRGDLDVVSFDHDLGTPETGYSLAVLMEVNNIYPNKWINIHSANPVGVKNILMAMSRAKTPITEWSRESISEFGEHDNMK